MKPSAFPSNKYNQCQKLTFATSSPLLRQKRKKYTNFWVLATVLLSCMLGGGIHQSMSMSLFFLSPSLLQKLLYLLYFFFIAPTLSCFQKRLVVGEYDCFVFSLQHLSQPVKSKLKPHWLSIISWQDTEVVRGDSSWEIFQVFSFQCTFKIFIHIHSFHCAWERGAWWELYQFWGSTVSHFPAMFLRLWHGDESFFV